MAKIFPKDKVRARRDFKRFLTLIRTHTLLFQYQRETNENGQLIGTFDDLKSILPLAEVVLAQSLKELSPKQDKVLEAIQNEFEGGKWFHLKDLHERVKNIVSYRTLQRYVEGFVKDGLLDWNGEKAKESMYSLSIPVTLCRKSIIFTPNFMESLENHLRQHHLTSNDVNDVNFDPSGNDNKIDDIDANSCQNGLSSKKSNDNRYLRLKMLIDDIATEDIERAYSHSEACDCRECCPESDISWDKQNMDSKVERVIYKAGNGFEVVTVGNDGKRISESVPPGLPNNQIKRKYEE